MDVSPMEFTIEPSRLAENHAALEALLDNLPDGDIQPSKATAWSQVHLIWKQNNGSWRFTIDYRSLNKIISNEGWQIPQHEKDFCED